MMKDQFKEAAIHFQKVIDINPRNRSAVCNTSVALLYSGQLTQAVQTLENFILGDPKLISKDFVMGLYLRDR